MTKSQDNIAFIVGHYKSGSTWLLRMLSLHPAIRGVRETNLFELISTCEDLTQCTERLFSEVPWSYADQKPRAFSVKRLLRGGGGASAERPHRLADFSTGDQRALRRSLSASKSKEEYCRTFFGFLHDRLNPSGYLLEKTPQNTARVPLIKSIFPDCKLIAIYRDGRDVIVSDRFFRESTTAKRNPDFRWSSDESIRNWRNAMESQQEYADKYGILTVAYEALKEDGPRVVARLLEDLALDADAKIVEDIVTRSSFEQSTGRKPGEEDQKSFMRKGIVGDWKNHFTDRDKAKFKEIANDMLVALGYERDSSW